MGCWEMGQTVQSTHVFRNPTTIRKYKILHQKNGRMRWNIVLPLPLESVIDS